MVKKYFCIYLFLTLESMSFLPNLSLEIDSGQNFEFLISNHKFEKLLKTLQLLRISQIRFFIQKFSLPSIGNKSKLLFLLTSILLKLRYDPLISLIYKEANQIMENKNKIFFNPCNKLSDIYLISENNYLKKKSLLFTL